MATKLPENCISTLLSNYKKLSLSLVHPTSTLMLYIVYGYKPLSLDKIAIIKGEKGMKKAKRINEILSGKCYSKCK